MMGPMVEVSQPSSGSIARPDYWWYRAREDLLREVFQEYVGRPADVLDVGSADGPSVRWMSGLGHRVPLDTDRAALPPGGVCGSALALPFADGTFDVVAAFDVVEHCEPESRALSEMARVLRPGGRLLLSVPAYQWAWSDFDVVAGHHRRYTRKRLDRAVRAAGLEVQRSTYVFAATLPAFAAERLVRRLRPGRTSVDTALPSVSPLLERGLLGLCRLDQRVLGRRDLPFGSSVVLAAIKP
jgi:SAM-dependent methyltransferase